MSPTEKFQRAQGETAPLPDGLRDLLAAGPPKAAKPAPVHKNGSPTRSWAHRPLTDLQKSTLSRLAKAAYALQDRCGLVDPGVNADAWRHAESRSVVGCRISEATQGHYKPLRGHFSALAGKTDLDTFNDATAAPDAPDRAAIAQALRNELARFAQLPDKDGRQTGVHRAEAYLVSIAKHRGHLDPQTPIATILEVWAPEKIEGLVNTMRNRIAAKLGVGKIANRNKSQRRG